MCVFGFWSFLYLIFALFGFLSDFHLLSPFPLLFSLGWRHFDDSSVSDVTDESRIVSHNAYLLFYKRREKEKKEDKKEAKETL